MGFDLSLLCSYGVKIDKFKTIQNLPSAFVLCHTVVFLKRTANSGFWDMQLKCVGSHGIRCGLADILRSIATYVCFDRH